MKKYFVIIMMIFAISPVLGQPIEYSDFEFTYRDGSISMSEVERMTDSLLTGRYRFYLARKQYFVSQSSKTTIVRNLTNMTSAVLCCGYGLGGIAIAMFDDDNVVFGVGGGVLIGIGLNSTRAIGNKARYAERADKNFQIVARNLNKEIEWRLKR